MIQFNFVVVGSSQNSARLSNILIKRVAKPFSPVQISCCCSFVHVQLSLVVVIFLIVDAFLVGRLVKNSAVCVSKR